jgi:hypothetical protein
MRTFHLFTRDERNTMPMLAVVTVANTYRALEAGRRSAPIVTTLPSKSMKATTRWCASNATRLIWESRTLVARPTYIRRQT